MRPGTTEVVHLPRRIEDGKVVLHTDLEPYRTYADAVYRRVCALLEAGWCQNQFVLDELGRDVSVGEVGQVKPWENFPTKNIDKCCLTGAIIVASNQLGVAPKPMMQVFQAAWHRVSPDYSMISFNDRADMTLEQVIERLTQAIKLL